MFRMLAATVALLAAAPATAGAATWTQPPAPCYVSVGPAPGQRELVPILAEGFAPNARIDVTVDGAPADGDANGVPDEVYADAGGRVIGTGVPAPYLQSGEREFVIALSERTNPANALTATVKVTALDVVLKPAQARPSRRVRFIGRGFTKRAPVYGHYLYGGKVRRTVRLARNPAGDCGTFSVRRRQIPVAHPRTGQWTLQVDQQKAYAPQPASVFVRLQITVQRVITPR
jgi:hypothetical protein